MRLVNAKLCENINYRSPKPSCYYRPFEPPKQRSAPVMAIQEVWCWKALMLAMGARPITALFAVARDFHGSSGTG
jgi:hypothetical protein